MYSSINTINMGVLPKINVLILIITFIWNSGAKPRKFSCGVNVSSNKTIIKHLAYIEAYPWMGVLIYPFSKNVVGEPKKTTVVLITTHMVLTTALEVDSYPKHDFRKNSRVVLGHSIKSGPYIRVVQYSLHPDFNKNYYSAVALIQIAATVKQIFELVPICGPPDTFNDTTIYAMTLVDGKDSSHSIVKIYEMEYIEKDQCKDFYRRNGLDVQSLWPRHVACARGMKKGHCLFQSGTVLVNKQLGKWHLMETSKGSSIPYLIVLCLQLGIGIYGPGCEAPARFLEYNMYVNWVRDSISKIGRVAITRLGKGEVILRRTASILGRYGPCDVEETIHNFYTDYNVGELPPEKGYNTTVTYNLTLFARIDYTCIALRAWYEGSNKPIAKEPELKIRKWCYSDTMLCASGDYSTIFFYVVITFVREMQYKISCYGTPLRRIGPKRIMWWVNQKLTRPRIPFWEYHWMPPNQTMKPPDEWK